MSRKRLEGLQNREELWEVFLHSDDVWKVFYVCKVFRMISLFRRPLEGFVCFEDIGKVSQN